MLTIALWIAAYVAVGAIAAFVVGFLGDGLESAPLLLLWPVGIPLLLLMAAFQAGEDVAREWRYRRSQREAKR